MSGSPHSSVACSFCGRAQYDVDKLIAGGPAGNICDGCVRRLEARGRSLPQGSGDGPCSFCGREPGADAAIVGEGLVEATARICTGCLAFCDEILEEELSG